MLVKDPAFFAAMLVASSERLREIENLTADEIERNGKVHLANFQGHLKTENILLNLAVESTDGLGEMPDSDYGIPDGEIIHPDPSDAPLPWAIPMVSTEQTAQQAPNPKRKTNPKRKK